MLHGPSGLYGEGDACILGFIPKGSPWIDLQVEVVLSLAGYLGNPRRWLGWPQVVPGLREGSRVGTASAGFMSGVRDGLGLLRVSCSNLRAILGGAVTRPLPQQRVSP